MCCHYTTAAKIFDTAGVYSAKFGIATDSRFPAEQRLQSTISVGPPCPTGLSPQANLRAMLSH
jgi:hypothetical protein